MGTQRRRRVSGLLAVVGALGAWACASADDPVRAAEADGAPVTGSVESAEAAEATEATGSAAEPAAAEARSESPPADAASEPARAPRRQRVAWAEVELAPAAAYDPEAAHTLFVSHCTACHGLGGRGDGPAAQLMRAPPRDFADGLFKLRTRTGYPAPHDLFRSISAGFVSSGMPSYAHLHPDDRWQLVQHVTALGRAGFVRDELDVLGQERGLAPVPEFPPQAAEAFLDGEVGVEWPDTLRVALGDQGVRAIEAELADDWSTRIDPGEVVELSPPPPADAALLARGAEVYTDWRCHQCHGPEGRGDGPSSATLVDNRGRKLAALELRSRAERYKGGARPEDIARTLATGLSGTPMPSFRIDGDDDADLWALAHFVASWAGE